MGINWNKTNFQLDEYYIFTNIKIEMEIFNDIFIEMGNLYFQIPYTIDWPPLIDTFNEYFNGLKEKEKIKQLIIDKNISEIKSGKILIDKDYCISSSFSCLDKDNNSLKIEFNKYKIKQDLNDYKNLPFVKGKKYTKYEDFGMRGFEFQKFGYTFNGMRLGFMDLSNDWNNALHINGVIIDHHDKTKLLPYNSRSKIDWEVFGRINKEKYWTYLGSCKIMERYSERQTKEYFSC
jgi:hypothetical protein